MSVLNVDRADFLKEEDIVILRSSAAKCLDEHARARVQRWREAGIVSARRGARPAKRACSVSPCRRITAAPAATSSTGRPDGAVAKKRVSGFAPRCTTPSSRPTSSTTAPRSRRSAGCRRWRPANHRRHRHDRAGRRLGPAGRQDHGAGATATTTSSTGRRPSSPTASSPIWSSSSPRPIPTPARKGISLIVVETTERGLQARPQARQDRHGRAGHVGTVLRGRARAELEPARREEGKGFVQLMQQLPQERLTIAIPASRRWSARSSRRSLREGAQGVRQAAHRLPEHAVQAGRVQDRGDRSRRVFIDRLHRPAPGGQARRRDRRRWPSTGLTDLQSKVVDTACSSSAATAT